MLKPEALESCTLGLATSRRLPRRPGQPAHLSITNLPYRSCVPLCHSPAYTVECLPAPRYITSHHLIPSKQNPWPSRGCYAYPKSDLDDMDTRRKPPKRVADSSRVRKRPLVRAACSNCRARKTAVCPSIHMKRVARADIYSVMQLGPDAGSVVRESSTVAIPRKMPTRLGTWHFAVKMTI